MNQYWLKVWLGGMLLLLLVACGGGREETIAVPTPIQQPATAVPTIDTETIPTPIPEPTATSANPTAVPSPTLIPTPTPEPTATAVSRVSPEPELVRSSANLPNLPQGVLFIADGALKRWNQDGEGVETLLAGSSGFVARLHQRDVVVGDVVDYAVNADGTRLVALRLTAAEDVADSQTHRYELVWLDLIGGDSRQLAFGLAGTVSLGLSDDGKYAIYVAERLSAPNRDQYSVQLVPAEGGGLPFSLGDCAFPCGNFVWHPDSSNVVWSDLDALWIYNVAGREPRKLLENSQATPEETVVYSPIAWARNGRYLLMWQSGYEGGRRAVLDVPTGQIFEIPDSFVYADPAIAEVSWMQDNRLLVMRPNGSDFLGSPTIELWRVEEGQGELVLEESSELTTLKGFPVSPVHLQNGRFGFALENQNDSSMSGLYILTALGDTLTRSNGIFIVGSIWDIEPVWAPDGSGAIVGHHEGQTLYAPADGDALYDITTVIGTWARDFRWLPKRSE